MPPPDGQDLFDMPVLQRIFTRLEDLRVDGAVNKENLKQIRDHLERINGRTATVESKVVELAATVQSHAPLFAAAADAGERLLNIEQTCASRSAYPARVDAVEKAVSGMQVTQAANSAAIGAAKTASDQWLDRLWPLVKAVLYVVFAVALYNAKAFLHIGP
jgi:hypothetical protein